MIENALFIFLILYTLAVIFFLGISLVFPKGQKTVGTAIEPVSIVIPFKNEAENLPTLIAWLQQQDFQGTMEVVFIDDGSDDESRAIIERARAESAFAVRLLTSRFDKKRSLTSKQQALDLGIREASYPLIALTDADMTLEKQWLRSLAVSLHPGSDLVFGHTAILPGRSFFSIFQSFQLASLFSIAAVFHHCGIAGSCMGNNLLLRKAAYLECGGHDAIGYSITEDCALLRHFRRCRRKTGIVAPFYPMAFTAAHHSLRLFLQQARRWVCGGFADGINLFITGVVFTLQNAAVVAGAAGFFSFKVRLVALINFFLTWGFLAINFQKNRSPITALFFPLYFLLLLIETIALLPAAFFKQGIVWKGNRV
ncbi:MAG: glycosyltransferase [Chitinispirillaceae bacterium]|nr:glycosyltransferase [Chitinispirillaceae bacterium]